MGNRNSGRRPKSTALKLIDGNPGKRPLNDAEPQPPDGKVEQPAFLSPQAAVVWSEIAPVAIAMGTLTTGDVLPFARLCELEATARQASSQKSAPQFAPFLLAVDFNDAPTVKVHPALKLERETAAALRPYYDYFGLNPTGRARIKVTKPPAPVSKWAGMGVG